MDTTVTNGSSTITIKGSNSPFEAVCHYLYVFSEMFIGSNRPKLVKLVNRSKSPYPAWWDVDLVLIPIFCPDNHWFLLQFNIYTLEFSFTIWIMQVFRKNIGLRLCINTKLKYWGFCTKSNIVVKKINTRCCIDNSPSIRLYKTS